MPVSSLAMIGGEYAASQKKHANNSDTNKKDSSSIDNDKSKSSNAFCRNSNYISECRSTYILPIV